MKISYKLLICSIKTYARVLSPRHVSLQYYIYKRPDTSRNHIYVAVLEVPAAQQPVNDSDLIRHFPRLVHDIVHDVLPRGRREVVIERCRGLLASIVAMKSRLVHVLERTCEVLHRLILISVIEDGVSGVRKRPCVKLQAIPTG